jgi:hypothetical protein
MVSIVHHRDERISVSYIEFNKLKAEIEQLKARLAELQQPEGEQEGRVIEWLCKRGYVVTKGEQK